MFICRCCVIVVSITFALANDITHIDVFKELEKQFIDSITAQLKEAANWEAMSKELSKVEYKTIPENGQQLDSFVKGLERSFHNKKKVLEKMKTAVQNAKRNHRYNPEIDRFEYMNMRKIDADTELTNDTNFSDKFQVNLNSSFVQVPTNIWEYKTEVLNTVEWTKHLDETFISNFNSSNDTLLHQYYGDSTGKIIF